MATDLDQIAEDAAGLIRRARALPVSERAPLLRELAELIVTARGHFLRPDGGPDWRGSTYPYREWVRSVYTAGGVPRDEHAPLQSTLRYHISSVLHQRLDAETLAELGLDRGPAKERDRARHRTSRNIAAAFTAREVAGGALVALTAAHAVLSKVDPADLQGLEQRAHDAAGATLSDIEDRVVVLRRSLDADGEAGVRPVTSLEFQSASPPE